MLLNGCGSGDNRVLEEVSEKVYPVEPNANISIHNRDGAVLVYGSDVNEMRVQAVKKAYSRERLNQIAIDVSTKPGAVSVTTQVSSPAKVGTLRSVRHGRLHHRCPGNCQYFRTRFKRWRSSPG